MEYDPKDNEVIHLLKKLKNSNGAYPPEMLALRRQGYLKQVSDVSAGAGLAMALRNIAKGGKGSAGLSSTAGTVVEALLVVALVAEAGVVTYFNSDKVTEYIRSVIHAPKVQEVASPPVLLPPVVEMQITPSPLATITKTVTVTDTVTPATPSDTPSPVLAANTALPDESNSVSVLQSTAASDSGGNTSGPSVSSPQNPKGNNGNHYGQTPEPERTKESGQNGGSSQDSTSSNKKKP